MHPAARRNLCQIRPLGSDGPWYDPHRDLANIGPTFCRCSVFCLQPDGAFWKEDWFKTWAKDSSISAEDFCFESECVKKYIEMWNLILKTETPTEAAKITSFSSLPPPLQIIVYAAVGKVALEAVWCGVKDVSRVDSGPPVSIEEFSKYIENCTLLPHPLISRILKYLSLCYFNFHYWVKDKMSKLGSLMKRLMAKE